MVDEEMVGRAPQRKERRAHNSPPLLLHWGPQPQREEELVNLRKFALKEEKLTFLYYYSK